LFAQEEITIKATGEFAKELKELMEKYQTSDINGSIEIIDENAAQDINATSEKADETAAEENKTNDEIVVIDDVEQINTQISSDKKEEKSSGLLNLLFGKKEINGDAANGEILYRQNCLKCHGEKAEKSSYLSARNLITLSKEEIADQVKNYRRDSGYGGSAGLIMRVQAVMVNDSQVNDIASYIESLK
jgi:cytochrome c553